MCEAYKTQYGCNFISVMPTNLYGPNDNYDLEMGHVPAATIAKVHRAKLAKARERIEMIYRIDSNTDSENQEDGLRSIAEECIDALAETEPTQP